MIFDLKSTFSIKKLKILRPKVTEIFTNLGKSFVNIHTYSKPKHFKSWEPLICKAKIISSKLTQDIFVAVDDTAIFADSLVVMADNWNKLTSKEWINYLPRWVAIFPISLLTGQPMIEVFKRQIDKYKVSFFPDVLCIGISFFQSSIVNYC